MTDIDIEKILKSLDNDDNENILNLTKEKIHNTKKEILSNLNINNNQEKQLLKKLENYRYVDSLVDIKEGYYVRWINLINNNEKNNYKLENGGIIIDIKIFKDGIKILCKNIYNKIFYIILDDILLFQKSSNQERIILDIIDYIKS